ncbi:hypothetical protein K469DRAFT_747758 [Zopfia rhizophila CBS 207.26]|uniref:RING-type domain-containing protein n=1 Tax=Zopfia rhizophila CBS 207.26 TaxID=1314779 RepID=A0A6A6EEP5_9PEZI|nr:hypothetical protein K469DRAFT_747758 [Zopfia rhizophila CBS 207.26]
MQCSDTSGLSGAHNANRQCPACGTRLTNPDDVVVAGLNPTEDYKTSVLSGLGPTIIMECASRGLAFYSYQASQEIIYQEHLAKSLTEKYTNLSQQMDQLIHDANSQIKVLQDKLQVMQAEQISLEQKNHDLVEAFREKSRTQQQVQKLYQSLKAQVMASHVANAAGDEAEFALHNVGHTARGDRYVDRIPGTRTGTANFSQIGAGIPQAGGARRHNRGGNDSSGSSGRQRQGGIELGLAFNNRMQGHGPGGRIWTGQSAPVGTPSQQQAQHRSRLPVLGSTRQNAFLGGDAGVPYQPPPLTRQPLGVPRSLGGFGFGAGAKAGKRHGGDTTGPLRK